MNTRIRDVLFLFMSFSLIFNMLPVWLHIPFISGTMHGHMLIYPAIIGVIYTFYCEYKGMHVFEHRITVLKYLSIFFIINLASLLIGFYKFPYWHYFMTGPVSQIEKLPLVLEWCKNIGIILNQEHIVVFWFALRQIKMVFCDALYAFGFSYLIYCWYRNDWKQGFNVFCRGVIASIIFVGIYCVIEVWFLSGSEIAKNVLVTINPYIHAIKIIKDLWPPLLSWPHQLRAVFPEPSHMGNYAAYALPVLWYWLFKVKEKHNVLFFSVLCFYFSFLILLSKARTATAIYFGLIFLLLIGIFFVLPTRKYLCKISALFLVNVLAFGVAVMFVDQYMPPKITVGQNKVVVQNKIKTDVNNKSVGRIYIENNLGSLASKTKRSNIPRYAYLTGSFKVGIENFLLGTGRGLQTMYVLNNITETERNHPEIKNWKRYIKKQGLARNSIDAMNEYVSRFCQTGILGLLVFLYPFVVCIINLTKIMFKRCKDLLEYSFLTLMLIGSMVAAMNGSIYLNYSVWLILGIAFASLNNTIVKIER